MLSIDRQIRFIDTRLLPVSFCRNQCVGGSLASPFGDYSREQVIPWLIGLKQAQLKIMLNFSKIYY